MTIDHNQRDDPDTTAWLSISDIMSGLTVFFVLINAGLFWLVITPGLEEVYMDGDCIGFSVKNKNVWSRSFTNDVDLSSISWHGNDCDRDIGKTPIITMIRKFVDHDDYHEIPTAELAREPAIMFKSDESRFDDLPNEQKDKVDEVCLDWIDLHRMQQGEVLEYQGKQFDPGNLALVIHGHASCQKRQDGLPAPIRNYREAHNRAHSILSRCVQIYCYTQHEIKPERIPKYVNPSHNSYNGIQYDIWHELGEKANESDVEESNRYYKCNKNESWEYEQNNDGPFLDEFNVWNIASRIILSLDGEVMHNLNYSCRNDRGRANDNYQTVTFSYQYLGDRIEHWSHDGEQKTKPDSE